MIGWLGRYCQELVLSSSTKHDPQTKKLFVTSLMQFLSNYAACGARFSVSLWNLKNEENRSSGLPFGEVGYRNAMAAAMTVGSRLAVAAVVASMYNSYMKIEEGYDQDVLDQCLHTLCSSRGLCSQLMLSVPDAAQLAIRSSSSSVTSSDNGTGPSNNSSISISSSSSSSETTSDSRTVSDSPPKSDPLFEWMHRLFFYLLQHRRLSQVFVTLQPRAAGESLWEDGLLDSCALSDTDIDINRVPSSTHSLTHEQVRNGTLLWVLFITHSLTFPTTYSTCYTHLSSLSTNLNACFTHPYYTITHRLSFYSCFVTYWTITNAWSDSAIKRMCQRCRWKVCQCQCQCLMKVYQRKRCQGKGYTVLITDQLHCGIYFTL